jgi:hypothetical protein
MRLQRYNASEFALVKALRDTNEQKQQLEEKLRAAEELSKVVLENAARREIVAYIIDKNGQRYQNERQDVGIAALAVKNNSSGGYR